MRTFWPISTPLPAIMIPPITETHTQYSEYIQFVLVCDVVLMTLTSTQLPVLPSTEHVAVFFFCLLRVLEVFGLYAMLICSLIIIIIIIHIFLFEDSGCAKLVRVVSYWSEVKLARTRLRSSQVKCPRKFGVVRLQCSRKGRSASSHTLVGYKVTAYKIDDLAAPL